MTKNYYYRTVVVFKKYVRTVTTAVTNIRIVNNLLNMYGTYVLHYWKPKRVTITDILILLLVDGIEEAPI